MDETARRARRVADKGRLRVACAWAGLVLGTMFAAAGLVDAEVAVVLVFGPLAVWCGWLLITWDRAQDLAAEAARRADLEQQLQRMLRRPEGR
ncbi:hypothetical protein FEK35_10035 [Nocardia cyriacigeorgica]|uniref:Uncharacterized protein n=1 Tax=Nocardia cyriacigeorgica TaxID=135487 RepID=A0A5R8PFN3_9NOCA|nr:hypothetical protein [Nocardia cyriacigeorgica]TLG13478.1 hypothetical protein FEK35_10035 [Nocardia cyriacigeorgica]